MDRSSLAPRALDAASLETPGGRKEGKKSVTSGQSCLPLSEKISANSRGPEALEYACQRSGSGRSWRVPNLGRRPRRATCFAQFSMEPWTHRVPGRLASFLLFPPLFFKRTNLK